MREILFRGQTRDGDWVYGYYVNGTIFEHSGYIYEVDRETVEQFTGFDIHGLRIFDGDVLCDKTTGKTYTVCFVGGAWRLSGGGLLSDFLKGKTLKVIGNIHEKVSE